MNLRFLSAAKELLSRTGKPMHYGTITSLALKLGVLESSSRNPEVIMSSTLSREAANHPQSAIMKVRPGVYELLPAALVNQEIGESHCLGVRVQRLIPRLKCFDELNVLRRALHILRQCLSITNSTGWFKLGDGISEVELNLLDPLTIRTKRGELIGQRDELIGQQNDPPHTFRLDRTLIQAAEEFRMRLRFDNLETVVDLAVSLAEIASCLHSDGFIIAVGRVDSVMIRVARFR